jgi:hypothetical protein
MIARVGIETVYYSKPYESRYGLSGDVKSLLKSCGVSVQELALDKNDFLGA